MSPRGSWPRGGVRTRLPVTFWKSGAEFTPADISGLALWLDASDAATLYTTDAGAVTAVAAPTDIAGCVGWWDASDASTLRQNSNGTTAVSSDDDPVGYWADKSTSGFNVIQASSGLRPLYKTTGLNGKPSLLFDGSDDALRVTPATPVGSAGVTVFAVFQVVTAGTYVSPPLLLGAGPNARPYDRYHAAGSNLVAIGSATSTAPTLSLRTQTTPFIHSMTVQKDGASSGVHRFQEFSNGVGQGTIDITSTYSVASQVVSIGARADGATLLNARVSEIVLYDGVLSTAQRARVEAYLAQRWGISGVHAPATASSDPVGAWLDKSGNARHATQSTAGNRPTVGASSTAGKNAVRNNGTGTVALQVAAWPYTAGNTQFAVFNASAINQGIIQRGSLNDEPRMAIQAGANGVAAIRGTRGGSVLTQTHSEVGYALSQWAIGATLFNTSLGRTYRDGVYGTDTTDSQTFSGDQELRLLSLPSNIYGINGGIAELLYYDRQLTATEVTRVARYLSSRWGITLAPQVSNADAQDWINRVYANGGTVSASTAAAVNALCDSLDAASLRDRFYRLNLFCGSNLNAALVPLYRGPSLGGTQYGNTTDTNNAFVGVGTDYAETGAGGGLLGNGTSKYLNTGLTVSNIGTASSGHMSAYHGLSSGVNANRYYMGVNDASTSNRFYFGTDSFSSATVFGSYGAVQNASQSLASNGHGPAGHRILSRETDSSLTHYHNGSVVATNTTPITPAVSTAAFAVFAANRNGTVDRFHNSWIAAYSIGLGFNSAQAAAYRDIMQTFQTALGRNV